MAIPNLLFATRWRQAHKRRRGMFKYWSRSNIVLHMSLSVPPPVCVHRTALYRRAPAAHIATATTLCSVNLEMTRGHRAHYRLRTINDGKFLVFGTGNIILAGRQTHASACVSSVRMIRLLASLPNAGRVTWPAYFSSPNAVLTGQTRLAVQDTIKTDTVRVNFSPKFPGLALAIGAKGVTPELYLRRGMIIVPGITGISQFDTAVDEVTNIIAPHLAPERL